jgi:hypothetical protein
MWSGNFSKTVAAYCCLLAILVTTVACHLSTNKSMKEPIVIDVFSGRPNPSWIPDDKAWIELQQKISTEHKIDCGPVPDALGYKGFLLRVEPSAAGTAQTIRVFKGKLWYENNPVQCYTDNGDLEKWLIDQAKQHGFAQLIKDLGL